MSGGRQVRVRRATAVLLGLLLALCGVAQARATTAPPAASPSAVSAVSALVSTSSMPSAHGTHWAHGTHAAHAFEARQAGVSYSSASVSDDAGPADDSGPSRCHKSKGDDGALPAVPSTAQQQTQALALPVCLTPESHVAIGTAHARPPVRGPAPAPPPTPIELSVLRV